MYLANLMSGAPLLSLSLSTHPHLALSSSTTRALHVSVCFHCTPIATYCATMQYDVALLHIEAAKSMRLPGEPAEVHRGIALSRSSCEHLLRRALGPTPGWCPWPPKRRPDSTSHALLFSSLSTRAQRLRESRCRPRSIWLLPRATHTHLHTHALVAHVFSFPRPFVKNMTRSRNSATKCADIFRATRSRGVRHSTPTLYLLWSAAAWRTIQVNM